MTDILTSEYLAVGSPTINNQMLPTVASFLCYLKGLTAKGHKAFAFGSYGWGGQSIALVEDELKAAGCDIVLDKQRLLTVSLEKRNGKAIAAEDLTWQIWNNGFIIEDSYLKGGVSCRKLRCTGRAASGSRR